MTVKRKNDKKTNTFEKRRRAEMKCALEQAKYFHNSGRRIDRVAAGCEEAITRREVLSLIGTRKPFSHLGGVDGGYEKW